MHIVRCQPIPRNRLGKTVLAATMATYAKGIGKHDLTATRKGQIMCCRTCLTEGMVDGILDDTKHDPLMGWIGVQSVSLARVSAGEEARAAGGEGFLEIRKDEGVEVAGLR